MRLAWLAAALILTVLLSGCSRVTLVYNTADLFARQYASDYLGLSREQMDRWEPRLTLALSRHRAEELPHLAAFFDRTLQASRVGFDATGMSCLSGKFRDLYRRQARLAVELATPLLADLRPSQIGALARKFAEEAAEDRADLAKRDWSWETRKRARRYVRSIEDWTGRLSAEQGKIVAEVTARMPDAEAAVVDYRARKRGELISLLENGASEERIGVFMTAWLVDFADLPEELERAGETIESRIAELFIRLGASLDDPQRAHLDQRLRQLRDDLMKLQRQPRLALLSC
ncbi:hypothetical protein CKO27_19715 [Thiocystis violacea]|nr:hypothetical protein [Thiocystis violacea]